MFAVIDIETTGTSAQRGRITEIAIYVFDGNKVIDSFVSLVNPECPIPYFITRLTGISDYMVADAPRFCEIARKVVEMTENNVFVAHNVSFDYNFVREEFRRLGYEYRREKLCTVSLSRKLIPGHRSYSLGSICQDLGIEIEHRHRAAGDAKATVNLLVHLLKINDQPTGSPRVRISSPEHTLVRSLPETTGVYYLINEQDEIIYIGKSLNIRKRVNNHLLQCNTRRTIEMKNSTVSVSYTETGSELLALLLESQEIKNQMPLYNRRQRRQLAHYGLYTTVNGNGYICLKIDKTNRNDAPLAAYPAMHEARQHLFTITEHYNLCQKLCGLYQTQGACFHHSIRQCKGACIGLEPPDKYNERVRKLIATLNNNHESFFIIEPGRHIEEHAVVKVEKGKYIGFGYFDPNHVNGNPEYLHDSIKPYEDNRDVQQIIRSYMRQGRAKNVIKF
ncbi:MAG: exonuclease domain-containing protein [Bacteroidales bacterium]|nr:exonuclease domain-containing protein [Bacteroidales bacterium]MDZ4203681.1 exonuclease domain-containing protein [Bacteroidales bacterium]